MLSSLSKRMAAARRSRPRTFAVLLGTFVGFSFLVFAEGVFHCLAPAPPRRGIPYPPHLIQHDDTLGYRPKPGVEFHFVPRAGARPVYDVVYAIDAHGRRTTPLDEGHAGKELALFFGGSNTFGQGVDQDETMPCYFSQFAPRFRAYNYGFLGYGPQAMLAKLQAGKTESEVGERGGILVYTFIDHHIRRATGSMFVHNCWGWRMPYYRIARDGKLVRRGSFTTGRPLVASLYWLLGKSSICRYFRVNLPSRVTPHHLDLTCRLIEEAKVEFERRFESRGFFVLFYPRCAMTNDIIRPLDGTGVICLDFSPLVEYTKGKYVVPIDGHPSALAHSAVARALADGIRSCLTRGIGRR